MYVSRYTPTRGIGKQQNKNNNRHSNRTGESETRTDTANGWEANECELSEKNVEFKIHREKDIYLKEYLRIYKYD